MLKFTETSKDERIRGPLAPKGRVKRALDLQKYKKNSYRCVQAKTLRDSVLLPVAPHRAGRGHGKEKEEIGSEEEGGTEKSPGQESRGEEAGCQEEACQEKDRLTNIN